MSATAEQRHKSWRTWRRRFLNQDLVDELSAHFRAGATVKIAAGRIGVPPGVLRMWLQEGEKQLSEIYASDVGYPEHEGLLYHECAKATAEYLAERIEKVTGAAVEFDSDGKMVSRPEWRAQSWLLERRDEDFNPAAKVDIATHSTVEVAFHDREIIAAELAKIGFLVPTELAPPAQPALLPARADAEAAGSAVVAEPARPGPTG